MNDFGYVTQVKESVLELVWWALSRRVWAYREAAWALKHLELDLELVYRQMGRKGLEGIENVGRRPAEVVEGLLYELLANPKIRGQPADL